MTSIAFQEESTSQGTLPVAQDPLSSLTTEGVLEGLAEPAHLTKFRTVVGRRNADVVVNDPDVSRQHAVIERYGNRYLIRDLGSTNGTFVNGRKIEAEMLQPRDIIEVGGTRLVFRLELL
ncbi:MAG: FHA domain-containing protein [Acidobacteriota bacterium]